LAGGEERLRGVAEQAGFENEYYFCRLFKKVTGMTPTAFRKQAAGAGRGGRG
ncbi:MAG: helix-turn-helix transcriptional regulator, partial [Spirochaetes bacterium]|nr:helix-turn-helix transcriptional regulator [Spirochaetota bacterium]